MIADTSVLDVITAYTSARDVRTADPCATAELTPGPCVRDVIKLTVANLVK